MSVKTHPNFIVTIDGRGATGKDTLAENFEKSGLFNPYPVHIINVGNYVRYLTQEALEQKIEIKDAEITRQFIANSFPFKRFEELNESKLFTKDIEKNLCYISQSNGIYSLIKETLDDIVKPQKDQVFLILGRIAGTYFFPDADVKYYLDATEEILAARKGQEIIHRNTMDKNIQILNLRPQPDAKLIDTTHLLPVQVFKQAEPYVLNRFNTWKLH